MKKGIKFKAVNQEQALKLAKTEISLMEGSGVFSTPYYHHLLNTIATRYLRQGRPVVK